MLQSGIPFVPPGSYDAVHFGTFLKTLRHRHHVKQLQVLAQLPGWTQTTYSRVETGEIAPAFDQLAPIYTALHLVGVELTPLDRQHFLTLARMRIEAKKTYQEYKTDQEWDELRLKLSRVDQDSHKQEISAQRTERVPTRTRLVETRHLVGREDWLVSVIASLQEALPKKLVVLQGPIGIGKSSELHRIALHFLSAETYRPLVLLCELPAVERDTGPVSALDLFLATVLAEVGPPDASLQTTSLDARITFMLECLGKTSRPCLLLLDNAEHLLDERGELASCWQQFLRIFLRSQHRASIVLATREWPGWFEGERAFLAERMIPPLSVDAGALLLQQLGLASVPVRYLQRASEVVGGIPLCLEWVASLVQEPMWLDEWDDSDDLNEQEEGGAEDDLVRRLLRLLDDPSLFGGPIATKLSPLLERILEKRLSAEACQVLRTLALANIPLGKAALHMVCPRPRLLKELSAASLLVAYPHRAQVLPMVASAIRFSLSADQRHSLEERLIEAYLRWLNEDKTSDREMGAIIAEVAALYLKYHRLLDAAQLLIIYGWMSYNQGHAPRLARLAQQVLQQIDWHRTEELECASLALMHILFPFLGISFDLKHYVTYQRIRDVLLAGKVVLPVETEGHVTHVLMLDAINAQRFEEAQAVLEIYLTHLESGGMSHMIQHSSVIQMRALLLGMWCEYAEEQGETQKARALREQAIAIYRQGDLLLSTEEGRSPLNRNIRKRRWANWLNYLGYHLNRMGQYEEALQAMERAIALQEQGYVYVGGLAASYGEKSQILMELGRLQEALQFDEKAIAEVQRSADAGNALSQEDGWTYQVNRGRLYLRLGRVDEAEQLLREALPHIHARRRMYRMFAEEALAEIEQWRRQATVLQHQLDWRWVERYRELASYDGYWWLTWAGPFSEEEERQWDALFTSPVGEDAREQLGALMRQSRERELAAAIAAQREPRLRYPAIEIAEVRRRIAALLQLESEMGQEEPNAIVRRLYHGAIEEELDFLYLIEATHEGNTERFQECMLRSFPIPAIEEMQEAVARVTHALRRGLKRPETAEVSQRLDEFLRTRLHLVFDLSSPEEEFQQSPQPQTPSQRKVSVQAAKRFFEAVLRECGYDGWRVVVDPNATGARIEQGLRQMFLPDQQFTLEEIRHLLSHELLGHVARCAAGERSPLGLLGIHTKNSSPTEEGLAIYYERQVAALHDHLLADSGIWRASLAAGLACGVMTPPQTFLSVCTFLELFSLLSRLLNHPHADLQKLQKLARSYALSICLRTYRGVPDLERAGVCYLQDALYLHGLRMIEQAVAQDETVLDRLAVGVVALELLPDLQELGITSAPQPLRKLAYDPDLDSHILSFETADEDEKHA